MAKIEGKGIQNDIIVTNKLVKCMAKTTLYLSFPLLPSLNEMNIYRIIIKDEQL